MGIMNKGLQKKRELRRVEWAIIKRLVIVLYHNRCIKRTNIAMKASLSYDRCILYLDWMNTMDLIKIETDEEGFEIIGLSDRGCDLYQAKFHDERIHFYA